MRVGKKPKVAPVVGSQVKQQKMLIRQLKSLNIGMKRKINMKDSSDESDGDMQVDQVGPSKVGSSSIKKKVSASTFKELKKSMKRVLKSNCKGSRTQAAKIEARIEELKEISKSNFNQN